MMLVMALRLPLTVRGGLSWQVPALALRLAPYIVVLVHGGGCAFRTASDGGKAYRRLGNSNRRLIRRYRPWSRQGEWLLRRS